MKYPYIFVRGDWRIIIEQTLLRGLPQAAVGEMIRALSGKQPPEALVSLIYSCTEGNPLFIEALFQHLMEHGELTDSSGELRRDYKQSISTCRKVCGLLSDGGSRGSAMLRKKRSALPR